MGVNLVSIKVRPINDDDVYEIASGVVNKVAPRAFNGNLKGTVCDPELFGRKRIHRNMHDKVFDDKYTRTAVIELAKPVLNPFLAGSHYSGWKCLLNKKEKDIENIVYGKVAYDMSAPEGKSPWVKVDALGETPNGENWVFGAELLQYLVDNTDIEDRIEETIYEVYVVPHLDYDSRAEWERTHEMIGSIIRIEDDSYVGMDAAGTGSDFGWLFDKYYYKCDLAKWRDMVVKEASHISDIMLEEKYTDLALLLAIRANPSLLVEQIMYKVFVLPIGYRPNIESRIDPLNSQYNLLVQHNNALKENISYQGFSLRTIMQRYEKVVRQVRSIMVRDDVASQYAGKTFKCLTESLGGKTGLIRDRMQGVRADYSGRTVIACDPNMPMDCVGIPRKMLPKLLELNAVVSLKDKHPEQENMSYFMTRKHIGEFVKAAERAADGRYVCIGRQPTLWNLGIEAFKVVPVDGSAIVLSPLIVEPFNADFDGDQMHSFFAIDFPSDEEVRKLIAIENKLVYPMNGELTVKARHEIAYGLWVCTAEKERAESRVWSQSEIEELASVNGDKSKRGLMGMIFDLVCAHTIKVYDIVPIGKNYLYDESAKVTAGVAALKYAIQPKNSKYAIGVVPLQTYADGAHDKKFSPNWLKECMAINNVTDKSSFVRIITNITKLGFDVARIFPPSVSPICDIRIDDLLTNFNKKIIEREELLNRGIEIESSFSTFFNDAFDELQDAVYKVVKEALGEDNGFMRMMNSKAKGSKSNIMQMFGFKGRIMEDENTPFNTIISGSLARGLTSLEHFISAYGARQGIADKTLATAEPGYLSRKLEHCASNMSITEQDCGTTNGILWTYDDIVCHCDESRVVGDPKVDIIPVKEMLAKILVGRNVLIGDQTVYVSDIVEANNLFDQYIADVDSNEQFHKKNGIKMRSPITCANPCCAACYGKDLSTLMPRPKLGKPIGFIAAQSLGEPGTQLTMKNFQRGGVVSAQNLTSSFKKIDTYLGLTDMRNQKGQKTLLSYDAISPKEGFVEAINMGDGRKKIQVVNEKGKNLLGMKQYFVPEETELKEYVKVGDSFQKVQGDLNIKEILRYRSYEDAYKYLTLMLYKIYNDEVAVSCQHFEVIVASMCSVVLYTNVGKYRSGEVLSLKEYATIAYMEDAKLCGFTILGIGELPKFRRDFLESIIMEDMKSYVPKSFLMCPEDTMVNPKTRLSFGLGIGIGSDVEGFLQ